MLRLGGQQSYPKSSVTLSDYPGDEKFGAHKDRYVQLPVCVMMGKGLTWAVMLTVLTEPQQTGSKIFHRVKTFDVPAYIVKLLGDLPLVTVLVSAGTSSRLRTRSVY